jgi:hypothetical protein
MIQDSTGPSAGQQTIRRVFVTTPGSAFIGVDASPRKDNFTEIAHLLATLWAVTAQ